MLDKKEILKAIRGGIKKWSFVVHMRGEDKGRKDCSLCQLSFNMTTKKINNSKRIYNNSFDICRGCIIVELNNGIIGCKGTPYEEWEQHHKKEHKLSKKIIVECPECRRLAQKELMFLQKLLESYKKIIERRNLNGSSNIGR